ncbi:MAG: hypothetical protein S0880_10965, partial [Actinomycetota bacterium]|nr:hypothetical protein [Actinomycetota bacterium]
RRSTSPRDNSRVEEAESSPSAEDGQTGGGTAEAEPAKPKRRRTTKKAAEADTTESVSANGSAAATDHLEGLELSAKGTVRVGALARHLDVTATELRTHADAVGVVITSNLATVDREQAARIAEHVATSTSA